MSKRTEGRMVITVGEEITRVNIIDGGKAVEILFSVSESCEKKSETVAPNVGSQEFEEMFPIVDIEGLSLEESFMQYEPQTSNEERVKASIIKAKEIGMKNFRKPAMDPSFADDRETIIYCAGEKPAVGKSANWWYENAPKFMPEKNSRMMDDLQKDVWLGILIKELVDEGYKVEKAWKIVCMDSKEIGHYYNAKNAKHDLERTGSRKIGRWFDLGNTCKIVKKRETLSFALFGGGCDNFSNCCPLADTDCVSNSKEHYHDSVGELVLDV